MLYEFTIAFAMAAAISLVVTPWVIRLAVYIKAIDLPNERKVHGQPTPRLGGMSIYLSFFFTFLILRLYFPVIQALEWAVSETGLFLLVGCAGILLLGIWDDVRQLGPGFKFIVQVAVSTLVYAGGVQISSIGHPFGSGQLELGLLSYPATVLWIVAIMNALNLIDGLDGLASGVALVASLTMCAVALMRGDPGTALIAVVLGGSILGFLRFNFNPARIFLGDSGSLFLGFVLAVLSILGSTKGSTAFAMAVPVLALGLPIMDTILAMVRRGLRPFMAGQRGEKPLVQNLKSIFLPDKDHIHHRLLALGLSQRRAVLLLYFVASALGCTAFGLTMTSKLTSQIIAFVVGTAVLFGVRSLQYREMAIFRNGMLLNLSRWRLFENRWFQVTMDSVFVVISFGLARSVARATPGVGLWDEHSLLLLIPLLVIQVFSLVAAGAYKSAVCQSGLADALRVLKANFSTLVVVVVLLGFLDSAAQMVTASMLFLYFYFVTTLVGGARFWFVLLRHWYEPAETNGKKILIYGADEQGLMAVQYLRAFHSHEMTPVGFLDEDPELEGKRVYGYTVHGGHWAIPRLIKVLDFDEILLASDRLKPEVVKRLRQIARTHRITFRKVTARLEDAAVSTSQPEVFETPEGELVHVEMPGNGKGRPAAQRKFAPQGRSVHDYPLPGLSTTS